MIVTPMDRRQETPALAITLKTLKETPSCHQFHSFNECIILRENVIPVTVTITVEQEGSAETRSQLCYVLCK